MCSPPAQIVRSSLFPLPPSFLPRVGISCRGLDRDDEIAVQLFFFFFSMIPCPGKRKQFSHFVQTHAHYPYESRNDSHPLANTVGQLIKPCLAQTAQGKRNHGDWRKSGQKGRRSLVSTWHWQAIDSSPVLLLPVANVSLMGACRQVGHKTR